MNRHVGPHHRNRWAWMARAACLVSICLVLPATGCRRGFYRRQADREVYNLIGRANLQTRTPLEDYNIWPSPASRMHDPNNPDLPPMPPDDPTSNRLMHYVDHKRGWPYWRCYGKTPFVENPVWKKFLCYDKDGKVVLDRRGAMYMARLNSREYQHELEDLYLSALKVTFERFRFDAQFFGGNSTFFTADGPDRGASLGSELRTDTDLEMRKLFATGGELVVGLANSLVWQFAGPNEYTANTLLDFSLVQPLLRAGGRAVVLEELTDAERALLANVRQMERYRRAFYVEIIAGRTPGVGPDPNNLLLSAFSLPTTGIVGGMLRLMEEQVQIRNQRANVSGLQKSLDQLVALNEAGRIDYLQVDQARQALYNAQSRLLGLRASYQDRLDEYKIILGTPPQLEVQIDDPLLHQFDLIDPKTDATQEAVAKLLNELRDLERKPEPAEYLPELALVLQQSRAVQETVRQDLKRLTEALPRRRENLQRLSTRPEFADGDVDLGADLQAFNERVKEIDKDFFSGADEDPVGLDEKLTGILAELTAIEQADAEPERERLVPLLARLSGLLMEMSVIQARARLDTVTLVPIEMGSDEALEIARMYRRDWKNARAALVDVWRQVEVAANDLESDLDITFSGDINTDGNHPFRFRGTTGRLRVGLEFDAPLTRLAERNAYREAIINYQQARRAYYAYEDRVSQRLRATLRTIRLRQLNFELQRAAVLVAISQVELTQLRLQRPPKAGAEQQSFGSTTTRDLVQALSGLLSAQNDFVGEWVNYEMQRMILDLDLGTMELDECGLWIDPGPVTLEGMRRDVMLEETEPEELPLPPGMPLLEDLEEPPENL